MRKRKYEEIGQGAAGTSQGHAQSHTSTRRFGGWLSRMIWRSCTGGMWTMSRDGKLGCETLYSDPGQPD
jgi:hypothetical protein